MRHLLYTADQTTLYFADSNYCSTYFFRLEGLYQLREATMNIPVYKISLHCMHAIRAEFYTSNYCYKINSTTTAYAAVFQSMFTTTIYMTCYL